VTQRPEKHEPLVERLMDLFAWTLNHQGTCLETHELTYTEAKLPWRLESGDNTPSLKEVAKRCGVDPSNLSSVIDQLVGRGLVITRPAAHDRRVKIVPMTGEGVRPRRKRVACLAGHRSIDSLPPDRQERLLQILREVA
jgi:DNA-binding MarR family transcriptional regulator